MNNNELLATLDNINDLLDVIFNEEEEEDVNKETLSEYEELFNKVLSAE